MRITNRQFLALVILLVIALAAVLFWQRQTIFAYGRRVATKNIVLVQKIRKLSDILFLPQKLFGAERLETYYLEIQPSDYQRLKDNLPQGDYFELEKRGLLSNAISGEHKLFVPAKLVYANKEYKADVRYRGTTYDHWFYPKKSWLIRFDNESPLGFKKVNLIIPDDRSYLGEELSNFRARKFGLLLPQSGFVKLEVNGEPQGVYWWVEDESKEMLAKNDRSKTGCLFGADTVWHEGRWQDRAFVDAASWTGYTSECGGQDSPALKRLLELARQDQTTFLAQAEDVLNVESVLAWDALGRLQGSKHGQPYNLRIYYDDIKKKFEFMPWDFGLRQMIAPDGAIDAFYNEIIARLLVRAEHYNLRNQILWDYVSVDKNLSDDLSFYDDWLNKIRLAFLRDANKNESNLEFMSKVKAGRQAIIDNVERIKKFLSTAAESFVYVEERGGRRQIRIETAGPIPVYLAEIECAVKCPLLDIYYDANQNGKVDAADSKLSIKEKRKDLTILDKIPINAERSELSRENEEEKTTPRPFTFIITNPKDTFEITNVLLQNYLTNGPARETVTFVNYETN